MHASLTMSTRRRLDIPILVSLFALISSTAMGRYDTVDLDQQQRDALRTVVKEMIGFKNAPIALDAARLGQSSTTTNSRSIDDDYGELSGTRRSRTSVAHRVPRYMERLYERYQSGEVFRDADTVRSINAQPAFIDHSAYIIFNLSSINDAESIIASQIHVYRKYRYVDLPTKDHRRREHRAKQHLRGDDEAAPSDTGHPEAGDFDAETTMNVFELAPSFIRKLAAFSISKSERSGWLSFDVTGIVGRQSNVSSQPIGGEQRLLAVRFAREANSPDGTTNTDTSRLTLSDYYQRFSRLVLLVFTKQQQQQQSDSADLQTQHRQLRYVSAADADLSPGANSDNLRTQRAHHAVGDDSSRVGGSGAGSRLSNQIRDPNDVVGDDRETKQDPDDSSLWSTRSRILAVSRNVTTRRTRQPISDFEDSIDHRSVGFRSGTSDSTTSRSASRSTVLHQFEMLDKVDKLDDDSNYPSIGRSRDKRSVDDNGVDEMASESPRSDSDDVIAEYNLPPRATSRRAFPVNSGRHRSRQHHHHQLPKSATVASAVNASSSAPSIVSGDVTKNVTGFSPTRTGSGRRRSKPRHSKKRPASDVVDDADHQSQLLPDPSEYVDGGTALWSDDVDDGQCKRRRLMVDFADIGWSDWIISPTSFEAFYCDGECRFPIPKKLRPTNHASIQSIVRAVGIQSSVPSPCCVPSSLTPLTLLYVEENHNIVVRNFPDMSVNGCACR